MIRKINKINNLGRFENFEGTSEFGKNTILFGFNGAGKSTLSDIFYSLTKDDTEEYLTRRRTLNREDESGEKNITIELTGEMGNYIVLKMINGLLSLKKFMYLMRNM